MRKPLGLLGAVLGTALLTATPAGADTGGPVRRHGGDVTFELTGADETLVVTGAGPDALAYTYTVGGQTTTGTVEGFTGSLRINDPGGAANLTVATLTVPGDLTVDASGPAQVALGWRNNLPGEIQVGGDLTVRTGDGADSVRLGGTVTGRADIRTRDGADAVGFGGFDPGSLPHSFTARSLSVSTGAGADAVQLLIGSTQGATDVALGSGDDSLRLGLIGRNLGCSSFIPGTDLSVSTGAGADEVTWTCGSVGRDAELRTGPGDDRVSLGTFVGPGVQNSRPAEAGRDLVIDTGAGADNVAVLTATAGRDLSVDSGPGADTARLGSPTNQPFRFTVGRQVAVNLGAGDDTAEVRFATLPALNVAGAAGNDTVTLTTVTVTGPAKLDGGPGAADRLVLDPATTFQQPPTITRFEL